MADACMDVSTFEPGLRSHRSTLAFSALLAILNIPIFFHSLCLSHAIVAVSISQFALGYPSLHLTWYSLQGSFQSSSSPLMTSFTGSVLSALRFSPRVLIALFSSLALMGSISFVGFFAFFFFFSSSFLSRLMGSCPLLPRLLLLLLRVSSAPCLLLLTVSC